MVLGYFGKTPVAPDQEIVKLASEKLNLEPTTQNPLDIADNDDKKQISVWKERLELEGIDPTEENIFIAASCDEKGITFLKGEGPLNVRKISEMEETNTNNKENNSMSNATGNYTVVVDGKKFNVTVAQGDANIEVTPVQNNDKAEETTQATAPVSSGAEIPASVNGNVWKILVKEGQAVTQDQTIMILEAMKMEIDIKASSAGTISKILVSPNDVVEEGQALAIIA